MSYETTKSLCLKRIAFLALISVSTASAVSAQTPRNADVQTALTPGMTAWITNSSKREPKTRIVDVSGDIITTTIDDNIRRLRASDMMRIQTRKSDSVEGEKG